MRDRLQVAGLGMLLLCGVAGCRHKAPPPPPPVASAPPLNPATITVITPLPAVPPGDKPDVKPAPPEPPKPVEQPAPVKRVRRLRRKPPVVAPPPQAAQTVQAPASSGADSVSASAPTQPPPSAVVPPATVPLSPATSAQEAAPALGNLSTGTAISSSERARLMAEIQAQESRLAKLKQPTTVEGQTIQLQVKTFLVKALQAVMDNDLDGAETLNTKARVLLNELEGE